MNRESLGRRSIGVLALFLLVLSPSVAAADDDAPASSPMAELPDTFPEDLPASPYARSTFTTPDAGMNLVGDPEDPTAPSPEEQAAMEQLLATGEFPEYWPEDISPRPAAITTFGNDLDYCDLKVNNPHNSTHVPGTINVVATSACSTAIPEIRLKVALYRNGKRVAVSPWKVRYDGVGLKNNAANPCTEDERRYIGVGQAEFTFPPNSIPPSDVVFAHNGPVRLKC